MKRSLTFILILSVILFFSACAEVEEKKENQVNQEETKKENDDIVTESNTQSDQEEVSDFHTEIPFIKKVSSDGLDIILDNVYEELCWDDCSNNRTYYYPDISSGDVEFLANII